MYEIHVIISHQQVIFTGLISFYKFCSDMYFTHVIFLLGSNVGRYPKMNSGYHRTTRAICPYLSSVNADARWSLRVFSVPM